MNKQGRKDINIIIPSDFTERELDGMIQKFNALKEKFSKLDKNKSFIRFDLGKVSKIDFFGYQYIFSFYKYLKNELSLEIELYNTTGEFSSFEEKYGLNIEE